MSVEPYSRLWAIPVGPSSSWRKWSGGSFVVEIRRAATRLLVAGRAVAACTSGMVSMFDDKHYEDLLQLVRTARGDGCMIRQMDIAGGLGVASPPSFG
eukprot:13790469-Heterocapsa_arctica.AAC.1